MKRLRKICNALLLSLCLVMSFPVLTVHASEVTEETEGEASGGVTDSSGSVVNMDTGDALQDIMSDSTYKGAISSISWFTERVDSLTVMLVSGSAFFIICAAFLKNVCAGVYCSNSKFFDKVDDAHKKAEALSIASIKGYFGGGQYQNTSYGAFRDSLLAIIPNFKAFTDFEDADIEPKQYFMKSIPQMCFCVIIGIFIYNGYYRDTAMLVGEFGSEAFVRVTSVADPVALLDKLSATTGMPPLATDGMTDPAGKLANDITKKSYRAIIGRYSDMTSDAAKVTLCTHLENAVIELVNNEFVSSGLLVQSEGNSWEVSGVEVNFAAATITGAENVGGSSSTGDGHWSTYNDDVRIYSWHPNTKAADLFKIAGYTTMAEEYPYYLIVHVNFKAVAYDGMSESGTSITGGTNGEEVVQQLAPTTAIVELKMVQTSPGGQYVCNNLPLKTREGYSINWSGLSAGTGRVITGSNITLNKATATQGQAVADTKGSGNVYSMSDDDYVWAESANNKYILEFHVNWQDYVSVN